MEIFEDKFDRWINFVHAARTNFARPSWFIPPRHGGDWDYTQSGGVPRWRKSQHGGDLGRSNRAIRVQYGILPYRLTEGDGVEVLLVTTRQTRRWIIPKSWPIKGLKPPKSAAREAHEEAGIRGRCNRLR
jgi:hypothetical protein